LISADLAALGWRPELEDELASRLEPGRVSAIHRGALEVLTAGGVIRCRHATRLWREEADVAVGDWVGISDGVVEQVLERRSRIVRNAAGRATVAQTLAANVDVAFVVTSLGPDLEPRRLERYLVAVWSSGAAPEIVLTKADRVSDPASAVAAVESVAIGVPVHVVSARTGTGCDELRERIGPGTTAVFLGSSGVGKSTLLNRLAGREVMATAPTREGDDVGRHTTTHRQLVLLPGGGIVIDTPGLRELQLWDDEGFDAAFGDVDTLAGGCRFTDCSHTSEPKCAVLDAVAEGTLAPERLQSWRRLERELRLAAARRDIHVRHEENLRWELRRREARARARRR
jgi:ribosome biogenesis GTPase